MADVKQKQDLAMKKSGQIQTLHEKQVLLKEHENKTDIKKYNRQNRQNKTRKVKLENKNTE